jgi:hypothetical protein
MRGATPDRTTSPMTGVRSVFDAPPASIPTRYIYKSAASAVPEIEEGKFVSV